VKLRAKRTFTYHDRTVLATTVFNSRTNAEAEELIRDGLAVKLVNREVLGREEPDPLPVEPDGEPSREAPVGPTEAATDGPTEVKPDKPTRRK
jgi:hypothetical protein